ncbi:sodium/proline symporter [Candidatus Dependentiae bacterium]
MNIEIPAIFTVYFLLLLTIAYTVSRKIKSSEEFILGGRSTNFFVTAIALNASDMSQWLFLAFPAVVYSTGLIRFWEMVGIVLFMFLNWQFVAPKLRRETQKFNAVTLFSYFEKRFKDNSGTIRILTSLVSVVFFVFYISAGLIALGKLFECAFGLQYEIGILIGLGIAVIYTIIGGFVAVAWCDFFQGLFAITMLLFVPLVGLYSIGGWSAIVQAAQAKGVSLSIIPARSQIWDVIWLIFIWGPGYFGQPQLLSFFMGIKDPKKIKYAKALSFTWQTVSLFASALIGLISLVYFHNGDETIFIQLTKLLFPPLIAGIILCAIIAATLSTLDSYILTAGSAIAQDVYKKIINKDASSNKIVLVSRIFSFLIPAIALVIALEKNQTIYSLIKYSWSGMGSAFGPLVIASLYGKNTNKYGAIAGILTGSLVAAVFPYLKTDIPELVPGFIAGYLAIYIVSLITRATGTSKSLK